MDLAAFTKIQKAVAEPNRLEIIELIRQLDKGQGIQCASILDKLDVAQSTFSHHISELMNAELISGQKEGRCMLLSVNQPVIEEYLIELKLKILGKT